MIPQHCAATNHGLMWSWCHTHTSPCRGLAAGVCALESRSITSVPRLPTPGIPSDNKNGWCLAMPRSAKGDQNLARGDLMLAPILCLHVPQSCAHAVSPCGMVLSADRQGSFSSRRHWKLYMYLCALPAAACTRRQTRCHHLLRGVQERRRTRKSGVYCKLHTVIKAGNSTATGA